jgi:hypothetical protein
VQAVFWGIDFSLSSVPEGSDDISPGVWLSCRPPPPLLLIEIVIVWAAGPESNRLLSPFHLVVQVFPPHTHCTPPVGCSSR